MRKRKKRSDERQSEEADEHQEMCRGEEQREVEHAHRAHGGEDDHSGKRREHLVIIIIMCYLSYYHYYQPSQVSAKEHNTRARPGEIYLGCQPGIS